MCATIEARHLAMAQETIPDVLPNDSFLINLYAQYIHPQFEILWRLDPACSRMVCFVVAELF